MKLNHYYQGKLLKSDDFINDQQYFMHHLQMIHKGHSGSGVIKGLELYQKDQTTLCLKKGMAIDKLGHLICVEEDHCFTLSECTGFASIQNDHGYVQLQYRQNHSEPIFCSANISKTHEQYDYLIDDYDIVVSNEVPIAHHWQTGFQNISLYHDEEIDIACYIPSLLDAQHDSKCWIHVQVSKSTDTTCMLHMKSSHYAIVEMQCDLGKEVDEFIELAMLRHPQIGGVQATFQIDTFTITKYGKEHLILIDETLTIPLSEHIKEDIYHYLEVQDIPLDPILLGYVTFSYHQEELQLTSCRSQTNRCASALLYKERETLLQLYGYHDRKPTVLLPKEDQQTQGSIRAMIDQTSCTWISKPIAHGLGAGGVEIQLAYELLPQFSQTNPHVWYTGDSTLFQPSLQGMQTGVEVDTRSGTFRIALRLQKPLEQGCLTLYWYARRRSVQQGKQQLLALHPYAKTLKPKEKCQFFPIFDHQVEHEQVIYSIQEGEGVIHQDGVYEAPAREGVYQICASIGEEEALAYVMVKDDEHEP